MSPPTAFSVAFGDFERGYVIVDRVGIRVLRDPYSAKPYVLFYTTKRVGGGVQNFEAIKLLKFGVVLIAQARAGALARHSFPRLVRDIRMIDSRFSARPAIEPVSLAETKAWLREDFERRRSADLGADRLPRA